jgi:plastocyanin
MKKILLPLLLNLIFFAAVYAATENITISGFSYSPNNTTVNVGDQVNIFALNGHPTTHVSEATWNSNGVAPINGALFVSETSTISFTITPAMAGTTIYYVCENHVSVGMKGRINVNVLTGIDENSKRDFNFTVYPNPVRSKSALNISLKKNDQVSLKIFSINGKLVSNYLEQKMNAGEYTLHFDGAKFETGIYIMQLKTSQGVLRKQILITH